MDSFALLAIDEELGLLSAGCTVESFALRKGSLDSLPSEFVSIHELLDGRGKKNEVIILLVHFAIVTATCGGINFNQT